jgi:hypothetical protein
MGDTTDTDGSGRKSNGQFAQGNPGGPGRPRRAVEREYLATISDAVPPDVWRKIVDRTVQSALNGNFAARDWLARHLLGAKPTTMLELAAAERNGYSPDVDVEREAKRLRSDAYFDRLTPDYAEPEPSDK